MDDLLTLLRNNPIFSSLSYRTRYNLLSKFEKNELEKDEVLYYQGDPSDSLVLILSGQLQANLLTASGENRFVADYFPGEAVGEIGAMTGELRPNTVTSIKNTIVFKLPRESFVELCHEYPRILYSIFNPIVSASQNAIRTFSSEKFKKHIVIMPANDQVNLNAFSDKLVTLLEEFNTCILISEYDDKQGRLSAEKISELIENAKAKSIKRIKKRILYLIKSYETELARYAFERAEMLYLVADENAPVLINGYANDRLNLFKSKTKLKPQLIFLHRSNTKLPHDTASWLQLAEFGLHHHIRINQTQDFYRLIRFIRNRAVGLVLSGGGTRGWAHIGAIKAIIDAGIPIDAIGGCSVGSVIGASYALTLSESDTLKQFQEIIEATRHSVSIRSLTWPAISLFNAKGLTNIIEKLFGSYKIEDLWIPYYCVSTNLAKNSQTIHFHGSLWEQIRCSVSIPGVIPPKVMNGEMHFDGGLLNNLPTDIMRKMLGNRSTIIGIELVTYSIDEGKYNFPPILTFWQTLLSKLHIAHHYKFPPFIDTFIQSLLVGSSINAKQNSMIADLLIGLDLSKYPMLYSNKKDEQRIIEIGYESTMSQLKNMKRKKLSG